MPLPRPLRHWGGGHPSPNLTLLDTRACGARPLGAFGASILALSALDLGPPFAVCKSWIRHCPWPVPSWLVYFPTQRHQRLRLERA